MHLAHFSSDNIWITPTRQSMDLTVYGPLKRYYNASRNYWQMHNPGRPMTIYDIGENFGEAFTRAFTSENITAGFKGRGFWPFDRDVFGDDEFLSSYVTDPPPPTTRWAAMWTSRRRWRHCLLDSRACLTIRGDTFPKDPTSKEQGCCKEEADTNPQIHQWRNASRVKSGLEGKIKGNARQMSKQGDRQQVKAVLPILSELSKKAHWMTWTMSHDYSHDDPQPPNWWRQRVWGLERIRSAVQRQLEGWHVRLGPVPLEEVGDPLYVHW